MADVIYQDKIHEWGKLGSNIITERETSKCYKVKMILIYHLVSYHYRRN